MDLYLVKLNSDATFQEGVYSIVRGYYGPVTLMGVEHFRSIFGGNVINLGPADRLLALVGAIDPGPQHAAWLQDRVKDLGRKLAFQGFAVDTASKVNVEDLPTVAEVEVPEAFECEYEDAITEMQTDGFDYKSAFGFRSRRPPKDELRRAYYLYKVALGEESIPATSN